MHYLLEHNGKTQSNYLGIMSNDINKRIYNNPNGVSPLILFIGGAIVVIFGYLFFASLDWTWTGSYGGHKNFTEYGLNYHDRPVRINYSWLKWIFYPMDILMLLIGSLIIRHGLKR